MPIESLNLRTIFDHALDLASESDRKAYLDEACAGMPEIRQQVEDLLKAHADAGSFLQSPAVDRPQTAPRSPSPEYIGTQIGPYKLVQQIGEGGMGTVFMAEQSEPVQRKVALKIIKIGMDTRQVMARFEAERQALALMDHPNIAKMLDAGTTNKKQPYFVMELVKGISHHQLLRPAQAEHQAATRPVSYRLLCSPARAPKRDHPSRFETLQRAGGRLRQSTRSQNHRLWCGQGRRSVIDRANHVHRVRPGHGHDRIYESRAG